MKEYDYYEIDGVIIGGIYEDNFGGFVEEFNVRELVDEYPANEEGYVGFAVGDDCATHLYRPHWIPKARFDELAKGLDHKTLLEKKGRSCQPCLIDGTFFEHSEEMSCREFCERITADTGLPVEPLPEESTDDESGFAIFAEGKPVKWFPEEHFRTHSCAAIMLPFGDAIAAMKQGYKVARNGWNGKGMHLWLKPEVVIKSEWCKDEELKKLVDENGGELLGLGTICMYTRDSSGRRAILTGWLASQSDMLSEDWYVFK